MEAACGRVGTGLPLTGGVEGGRRGAERGAVFTQNRIQPKQIHEEHPPEAGKLPPLCAAGFVGVCMVKLFLRSATEL